MPGIKRIVVTFRALGETGEAIQLAQGRKTFSPPGEQLVRVRLVTDIPEQMVLRTVEEIMQRDGEFHHAEICAQMATGFGECFQQELTNFLRELG